LLKDCGEEMHLDWWTFLGVKKSFVVVERIPRTYQTATTLVFGDFKGEFIKNFPELNHSP